MIYQTSSIANGLQMLHDSNNLGLIIYFFLAKECIDLGLRA